MTLREKIKSAFVPKVEAVNIPGLDEPVFVRELTGLESDRLDAANYRVGPDGKRVFAHENYLARQFIAVACDAAGKPLYGPMDVAEVSMLPASLLERVIDAGRKLNSFGADAEESAAKNS